jgi:hypothetical protein
MLLGNVFGDIPKSVKIYRKESAQLLLDPETPIIPQIPLS